MFDDLDNMQNQKTGISGVMNTTCIHASLHNLLDAQVFSALDL